MSSQLKMKVKSWGQKKNGNFLGYIELINKFDPLMAEHLARCGNKGRGVHSYLSSTNINEFILQLSHQVNNKIKEEAQHAKYCFIVVDISPDVSHTHHLTFLICYVLPDSTPVGCFIFLPNIGHTSKDLAGAVMTIIESLIFI